MIWFRNAEKDRPRESMTGVIWGQLRKCSHLQEPQLQSGHERLGRDVNVQQSCEEANTRTTCWCGAESLLRAERNVLSEETLSKSRKNDIHSPVEFYTKLKEKSSSSCVRSSTKLYIYSRCLLNALRKKCISFLSTTFKSSLLPDKPCPNRNAIGYWTDVLLRTERRANISTFMLLFVKKFSHPNPIIVTQSIHNACYWQLLYQLLTWMPEIRCSRYAQGSIISPTMPSARWRKEASRSVG
jgi:hypothetical protein